MAVDLHDPYKILDPMGGARCLRAKELAACGPRSFLDDPIRILRGIRFASKWMFKLEGDTRQWMKEAVPGLESTTVERRREEFLKILATPRPGTALRAMDWFGVLEQSLPGLGEYRQKVGKPAWEKTLSKIQAASQLLDLLMNEHPEQSAGEYRAGLAAMKLGRFQANISELFSSQWLGDFPRVSLWLLGILMGEVAIFRGEPKYPEQTGILLKLSRQESRYLQMIAATGQPADGPVTPLIGYRYYREFGETGVDCALAAGADAYEEYLDRPERLEPVLDRCRDLLDLWVNHQADWIDPPALIRGEDVIASLGIQPGPQVGWILEEIREKQVSGEITTREDAERWLASRKDGE